MVDREVRSKPVAKLAYRGSQVIFGERQHLREVLRSLTRARLSKSRKRAEIRQLTKLIEARTAELDGMNPSWDLKFKKARRPSTTARELLRLAGSLPKDDYLLARVLSEHPTAPGELLERLASHPYPAVRENVARHPNTPPQTLREMAEASTEPLWFLVACNSSTPKDLREQLWTRMRGSFKTVES